MGGFATYDKGGGVAGTTVYADNFDFTGTGRTATVTTNGQLPIGSTTANAGGNHINIGQIVSPTGTIVVGYSNPNITLEALNGGFIWTDTSGTFSAVKNNGYFVTATATANLPAAPSQGDTIKFFVDTTQILTIQASGSQIIRFGNTVTAAAGTAVSTLRGDSVDLTYRAADTCWCAIGGFSGVWNLT